MPPTYLPRDLLKTLRGDDFSAQADQDINDFKQRLGLGGSSTNSTPAPLAPAPVAPPVAPVVAPPAPVTPPPVQQPAFQLPSWNDFQIGAQNVGNQIQQGAQQLGQQASQFQLPDWGNFKLGGPSNTDQINQNAGPSGSANLPDWNTFKLPGAEDPTLTGTSSPGPNAAGAGGSSSSSAPVAAGGDLHAYARQAAQQAGIDPDIFVRQIQQESGFNPNAGSPAGAQGIAQIMPQYHPGVDTSDPYASLDYAANLMATHLKKYGGDYSKALSAYNAGEGATDSGAAASFGETQTYIKNILQGGTGSTASVAAPQRPSAVDQAALDDPDKWALCGPVAAVLAATAHGADWTVAQAKGIAQKLGLWDAGNGMHGLDSEVALLKQAGVAATTGAADEQHLAADANAGNTPIVSTDGHYYILQGYDAASGKFDTGTTGTVYKGGSRWLSLAEMQGLSGTIQGAAFMDNPASPNPSVVAQAEPDWRRGPNTPVASNDPLLSKGDVGNQQAALSSDPTDSTYGPFDPAGYGTSGGGNGSNPGAVAGDMGAGSVNDLAGHVDRSGSQAVDQALQGPEGNTAWSADYSPPPTPPEVPLSLRPQVRAIDQQPAGPIPGPSDPLQGEDPNAPQGVPSYPLNDALAPGGDLAQAARPHVPVHQLIDLERQAQDAEAAGDQPRADQLRAEQNDIVQNLALNMMGAPEAVGGMGRFYGRPGVPEPVPGGAPVLSAVDGLPRPSIPHSDQIAPATVQDAISRLPAEIQDAVSANVKGIKVSSAVSGQDGGGAYHPGSATAWVDPAHAADPQTIAHELLHGYVSTLNDPGFIADWAAVAYDPAVALTRSAEFRSGKSINADPFANENFTRSLDAYIHNPDQLNPPVRAVFDRRFAPPDPALAAEATLSPAHPIDAFAATPLAPHEPGAPMATTLPPEQLPEGFRQGQVGTPLEGNSGHAADAVPPSEEPKPATLPRTPPIPEGAQPITLTPEQEAARLRLDKFPDWAREAVHNAAQGVDYAREQRRGVIPDATSAGMADDLGRSVERWIREGKTGRNYNAEETRALRNTVTTQASVVNDLAARVAEAQQSGGLTDALLAEAHREGQKLGALTTVAEGARAEWGRAGRAYMAATKMVDMPPTMAAERIFKKFGGGPEGRQRAVEALTEYNRLLQDGADPIQLAKYWANVEKGPPNVTDWFTALRYNSMLSGPRTFEVNAVGNGLELPWRLGRDTLASTIRGRPGEVGPELVGTWVGMQRGAHAFMETLAHGITTEQALAGDLPNSLADRVKNPVGKATATALEMPGRLLGASDQFAKQTAYGMELGRRAAVGASKEGLSGAAWKGRVADLLATPSEEMMARSLDVARRMTYQNEMGQTGAAIQSFRRMLPGPVGNIVLPFMKTVYNISARGIDRSPLGIVGTGIDVARGKYGKDLGAALGGALPENGALVPLGERLGDNVIGGLAGLWFVGQAFAGNVTGDGPDDPGKKDILRAQGWQPYSIKVGDKWVSYSNWGPIALPLSMAAATAEGQKYAKPGDNSGQQAADTFARFAKLATEQSYLQAIGGVYKSISDPQRYGTQWVSDFVGSLVPYGALANTVGQAGDPYVHRPDKVDVGQALQNRLPGLRASVPVAQDVLGQPVKNPAQGAAAFQPFRASPQVQNPLLDAFQQAGVNIPRPGDHLSIDVKGAQGKALQVPITPDESRQWNTVRGELLQKAWDMFQAGPNWATYQQGNPEYQKTAMEAVLRAADTAAHNQMAEQIGPPEIRRRLTPAA